ncbi:hypothetical protein GY45DRAFT_1262010, partial [Cubamyces sp. BRFM 1775]
FVQRLVHAALKVLVYEVDGTRPRLLLLANGADWDPECGCPVYPEDLDTSQWFPSDQTETTVDYFPGTRCWLANGYSILSVPRKEDGRGTAPINEVISRLFAIEWRGPLVVVKRARRHSLQAINITSPEVSMVNAVVERYVYRRPLFLFIILIFHLRN